MYYYLGRTDDSVAAHKKAIKISPKDHLVWANLGDALAITAKEDEARAAFSKAEELAEIRLAMNPVDAEALIDMAWIKAMLGKKDEADKAIARAGEIRPGDPYVHFINGLIAVQSGDPGSAHIHLQEAIATGYPPKLIAAEPHLEPIRNEPWFSALTMEPVGDNKQNR
jgi:tetratricopeptide (TPR) repeat protein